MRFLLYYISESLSISAIILYTANDIIIAIDSISEIQFLKSFTYIISTYEAISSYLPMKPSHHNQKTFNNNDDFYADSSS